MPNNIVFLAHPIFLSFCQHLLTMRHWIAFRGLVVSPYQAQISVALLAMQLRGYLDVGWGLELCFRSAVAILRLGLMTMNHGLSEKRWFFPCK